MNAFTGCKVFCATVVSQRQLLGEVVTKWLDEARKNHPGFEVVDIVVRQSSDASYHCTSIVIFHKTRKPK